MVGAERESPVKKLTGMAKWKYPTHNSFIVDMNEDGVVDLVQWHKGTVVPVLHDWMYEAEFDASAFENKSGYVHIWYGSQN